MAQNKFTPAQLAPDLLAKQLRAQQQAQWGQNMLEQGQQMPEGQMVSGHYVSPSWTQYLAKGLQSYLGNKAMNDLPNQMADIQNSQQQEMMGRFGFGDMSKQQALANGLGPTNENAQRMQPMLIPGTNEQQSMAILQSAGPAEYSKLLARGLTPTNEQKNLGFMPEGQRNAILGGQALGQSIQDGMQLGMGPNGQIFANPIAGYAQGQAQLQGDITGAQERAKAGLDIVDVPTGDGGSQQMTRAQAVGQLGGTQSGLMSADEAQQALGSQQGGTALSTKQEDQQLNRDQQQAAGTSRPGYTPPPLKSTKERRDFEKGLRADIAAGQSTLNLVDRNIAYIDRLLDNPGLKGIVGRAAQFLPTMLMADGELEANADLDTIKSKVVLQTMEEMRKSSASGATGFGNMNREQLKVLQDSLGSLDRATTGDQIVQNLQVIRNAFEQIRNDAIGDFDHTIKQYGSFLGDRFQPGMYGQARSVVDPSQITGGQKPSLDSILGF